VVMSSCHRFAFLTDAPPERVWAALTCAETSPRYLYGMRLESEWAPGSPVDLTAPSGHRVAGEVVAAIPLHSLSYSLEQGAGPCRIVTWALRVGPAGTVVRLAIDDVDGDSVEEVEDAWLPILDALRLVLASPDGEGPTQPAPRNGAP